jgi:hypothetical protein
LIRAIALRGVSVIVWGFINGHLKRLAAAFNAKQGQRGQNGVYKSENKLSTFLVLTI